MTFLHPRGFARSLAAVALGWGLASAVHATPPPEGRENARCHELAFLRDNATAMDRMMAAMDAPPTGDIDRDFVAMMVPHHQGAIDMAQLVLRYGRNEQIRRIAQEIIVTQQQEIVAMRRAVAGNDASAAGETANSGSPHRHPTSGPTAAFLENCP